MFKNALWNPKRLVFEHFKDLFFLEGPQNNSIRIETCCPSTIINIINFVVFDWNIIVCVCVCVCVCIYIYIRKEV